MNPPKPPSGASGQAAWQRQILAYCESLRILPGPGYNIRRYPKGFALGLPPAGAPGSPAPGLSRYRFKSASDDYVACVSWDGTTEGTQTIYIAKPEELRCSNLGPEQKLGASYTYSYSAGPDGDNKYRISKAQGQPDENQLVTPPWFVNAVIYGMKADTGLKDPSGQAISLLAISPARIWAKV